MHKPLNAAIFGKEMKNYLDQGEIQGVLARRVLIVKLYEIQGRERSLTTAPPGAEATAPARPSRFGVGGGRSGCMIFFFGFFFLSGFCSLVYQVVWLRVAMAAFGVTTPLVSIVLSIFMAGLALGSWAGGRLVRSL